MAFINDLIIAPADQFEAVIRDPAHQTTRECDIDVGIESDHIVTIVAILRGIDLDQHLEELIREIHQEHLEDQDAFGTMIPMRVRDEIANLPNARIGQVAAQWEEIEGAGAFSDDRDLQSMLHRLVHRCREARNRGDALIIKSFE